MKFSDKMSFLQTEEELFLVVDVTLHRGQQLDNVQSLRLWSIQCKTGWLYQMAHLRAQGSM